MTGADHQPLPTPGEVAAADALARQFLEQISDVPVEQRTVLGSGKFAGLIADPDRGVAAEDTSSGDPA